MKRLIVSGIMLLLLGCLSAGPARAQKNLDFGAKLGLNSTGMFGDAVEETSFPKQGLVAGVFVRRSFTPAMAVQLEVLYTQKGSRITVENYPTLVDTITVKLDYIEIPVMFRYNFGVPVNFKPYILVGPALAFNVSAKGTSDDASTLYPEEFDIPNAKSFDFGLVFGTGVDFSLGSGAVGVDARYTLGLLKAFEDMSSEGTNSESDEIPFVDNGRALDLSNGGFSFMISYAF